MASPFSKVTNTAVEEARMFRAMDELTKELAKENRDQQARHQREFDEMNKPSPLRGMGKFLGGGLGGADRFAGAVGALGGFARPVSTTPGLDFLGNAAGVAGAAGVPGAQLLGAVVGLAKEMHDLPNKLSDANRRFAGASASMAKVMAESDVEKFKRERDQGERRAGTAQQLEEAKNRRDALLAERRDRMANVQNRAEAKKLDEQSDILKAPTDEKVGKEFSYILRDIFASRIKEAIAEEKRQEAIDKGEIKPDAPVPPQKQHIDFWELMVGRRPERLK